MHMPAIQCSQNLCSFLSFALLLLDVSKVSLYSELLESGVCFLGKRFLHLSACMGLNEMTLFSTLWTVAWTQPIPSSLWYSNKDPNYCGMVPQSGNLALLVTKHPGLQILKLACQFYYSNNFFPNFMTIFFINTNCRYIIFSSPRYSLYNRVYF